MRPANKQKYGMSGLITPSQFFFTIYFLVLTFFSSDLKLFLSFLIMRFKKKVVYNLEKLIIEPMRWNRSSANGEIVHNITFYGDILGSNQSEMWQTYFSGK